MERLGDGPDGERPFTARLCPQPPYPLDLRGQPVAGIALGQPTVALEGGPAYSGRGGPADPHRYTGLRGTGTLSEPLEVVELAVVFGELLGAEGGAQGVDRLVEDGPAPGEVDPEHLELLPHMARTHAENQPAAAEMVEGGVLLGGDQGVPQPDHRHVAQQPDAFGHGRQVGEGGDRVVPDRAHRGGEAARDRHVVAGGDVREPGTVGGPGHLDEVLRTGAGLPGFGVDRALGLDGQLDAVLHHFGPPQRPSGVRPSSSMALPRTIRSTTSGSRCPIWASPTSRDLGQVESEWG